MDNIIEKDNKTGVITAALSGSAGGALLGSTFGIVGSIVGAIVAAGVVGYSTYKNSPPKDKDHDYGSGAIIVKHDMRNKGVTLTRVK